MTQYLVEEACNTALELFEAKIAHDLAEARERATAVASAQEQVRRDLAVLTGAA